MHRRVSLIAFALVCAAPAAALDLPARKPGLWAITMAFEGRNIPAQARPASPACSAYRGC